MKKRLRKKKYKKIADLAYQVGIIGDRHLDKLSWDECFDSFELVYLFYDHWYDQYDAESVVMKVVDWIRSKKRIKQLKGKPFCRFRGFSHIIKILTAQDKVRGSRKFTVERGIL